MFKQVLDEVIPEYKDRITFYKVDIESVISSVKEKLLDSGITKIDYVEIRNNETLDIVNNNDKSNARLFIAVYIDDIRLIDNIKL